MLDIDRLYALNPSFDLLPYSEALKRQCISLTNESGQLLLVADRSVMSGILPLADSYIGIPFSLCFALSGDIAAVLAHHGEAMRAMDSLSTPSAIESDILKGIETLRLDTIQSDISPIVRLTNSTLYDAYKAGASDIHIESSENGLRVKYRLDGVLSLIAEVKSIQTAEQEIGRAHV